MGVRGRAPAISRIETEFVEVTKPGSYNLNKVKPIACRRDFGRFDGCEV